LCPQKLSSGASQQNVVTCFFNLWGKLFHQSPLYWGYSQRKKKLEKEICENVKWLKGAKLVDIQDALIIWIGQVNTKNGTASDEVLGTWMSVTNFVHRNYVLFSKNEIIVKMNTV
jgi:hypothetical protein